MKSVLSVFVLSLIPLFVAVGCKKVVSVDCSTKMRDVPSVNKNEGASFKVTCPANCTHGWIWGTDIYTNDSSVCCAAIHAGVIDADKGGTVTVKVVKGLNRYTGSERNGIKSGNWGAWGTTAFTVSK